MKRKIGLSLLLILIVIQFFHPKKNENAVLLTSDITQVTEVPDDVLQVLRTSCFDCHSNSTVYPWYSNIQPVAWWLNNHIKEGKGELNFSEFGKYSAKKANHKLHEVVEVLENKEMPLTSYTLIHRDAVLDDAQKALVINWAKNTKITD